MGHAALSTAWLGHRAMGSADAEIILRGVPHRPERVSLVLPMLSIIGLCLKLGRADLDWGVSGGRSEGHPPPMAVESLSECSFLLHFFVCEYSALLLSFRLPARLPCLTVPGCVFIQGRRAVTLPGAGAGAGCWWASHWVMPGPTITQDLRNRVQGRGQ